ncbi:DNA adenine methylase [Brachyspira hampsonii]|uniref:DNA adenine methylase n=1 Tax=Brachyspira hampsonii TaxID=1287055 RepID=UPI000A74FEB8|nr:DNA adenine methylase [Brachyspira hampsonii]
MNKKSVINHIETDKKLISILKRLPNNYWDFKYDNTKEYTHGIHSYPAVMVSPISRNIINIVRQVMEVDSLFDPFSGSGTVLVEGMLSNIKTIYGNDINPLAIFISKVKTNKLNSFK